MRCAPAISTLVAASLCLLSASGMANAQNAPAEAPKKNCALSVDVHAVDAITHEPVAGASVFVGGALVGLTNGEGHHLLRGQCAGSLTIAVERTDYPRKSFRLELHKTTSFEVELRPDEGEVITIEAVRPVRVNTRSVTTIKGEELEKTRGRSFSDALAEVPGVAQLRAASGMSKPVVRGHFGRRVPMLVGTVRHRSQDWGVDHAPEIDPFVAEELTVVRGAAGVQHGPDAIGGAVVATPPELPRHGLEGEAHMFGIQPRGGGMALRLAGAPEADEPLHGFAARLEGSAKRLMSARSPDYALDNTGVFEWNLGATAGYHFDNGDSYQLTYRRYQARVGVCSCLRIESIDDFMDSLNSEEPVDADLYTQRFEIDRPYQAVTHHTAEARGLTKIGDYGRLTSTYALQFDDREEFDVTRTATGSQFNFRLTTNDLGATFEHNPVHFSDHMHLRGSAGVVGMAQVHAYSGLPLIPDYDALSAGFFALERLLGHDFEVQAGIRYDALRRTASLERNDFLRLVRSDQLGMDACGDSSGETIDCASTFHTFSASLGGILQVTPNWSLKLDLSTAARPPNPDEQYLNGTSPTSPVLGLGKPDIGTERTYSASLTASFSNRTAAAEFSGYASSIDDYIYFAPAIGDDGMPIFDILIRGAFPRFITRPVDAVFYGGDAGATVRPIAALELAGQLSMVRAKNTSDDTFLAFVPPDRARGEIRYSLSNVLGIEQIAAAINGMFVAEQSRFDINADLAAPPDSYFLLGASLRASKGMGKNRTVLSVDGSNLLNTRYRDYTSLMRYFADQAGWQLMVRLSIYRGTKS